MKNILFFITILVLSTPLFAQEKDTKLDSISHVEFDAFDPIGLGEIILISNKDNKKMQTLGSIDNYLEQSSAVNMIKRGSYAWEPMLNGMSSERGIVTVDGMRIYQACTDVMDPVTSYVESSNFSSAEIEDGQSGSQYGGTIAGSIDLVRKRTGFVNNGFKGSVFTGYESTNKQKIGGTTLGYSTDKFFADVDFTYRDADNYKAGKNKTIDFSQYTKYNVSAITGFKLTEGQSIEASIIYDRATDVGYPALPMDVSLARAAIASLEYKYENLSGHFSSWETKLYYNAIKHVMDDSKRPDDEVPIRMDMPGWSKTWGLNSTIEGHHKKHWFKATLSGHHNNSLAEMTMFPKDPKEQDMFMLTWPDINTLYTALNIEDKIVLNADFDLNLSAGIGMHRNTIGSDFGLESLRIFYPDLSDNRTRILKNAKASLRFYQDENWTHNIGFGYGERAPSVSEGYGFYIFNNSDKYDYIGNPNLANEKSFDLSLSTQFKTGAFLFELGGNYYHIMDYIVGKPDASIDAMNFAADGVKVYEGMRYATLVNTHFEFQYSISEYFNLAGKASYRYGEDSEKNNLPQIQPFNYEASLHYHKNTFGTEISIEGSTKHSNYSETYGEIPKPGYTLFNWNAHKTFSFNEKDLVLKLGVQNIFDRYYTTFSDWNNIPRAGRNIFGNLTFKW